MSNPETNDFDDISAFLDEMGGAAFASSEEYDPVTKVATEWTRRDDNLYYARLDTAETGVLERFVRDDQQDDWRENHVTEKKESGTTVSVGYSFGLPNDPDRFELDIKQQEEKREISFTASYTPEGALASAEITLEYQPPSPEVNISEDMPEKNLEEIIDLYLLKGTSVFKPALMGNLGNEIDLSGDTPNFVLGTVLPKCGYIQSDIDTVMALASIPIEYHLGSSEAFARIPQKDQEVLEAFLRVITANVMIPPVVHKDNRKLWHRFEDIDPSTVEGLDTLMRHYAFSLTLFLSEHERYVKRSGQFATTFTPTQDEQQPFRFAIKQGREILYQQAINLGEPIRYERSMYTVTRHDNECTLSTKDVLNPSQESCIITFPKSIDTKALKEVLDTDDIAIWKTGFEFAPSSFGYSPDRQA